MRIAHTVSSDFCYNQLGSLKAQWSDEPKTHFSTSSIKEVNYFKALSDWKSGYHEFQNWVNLNAVMAMSSNFETYLSAVISLAITSDPGVLVGASQAVDGIDLIKRQKNKIDPTEYVTACTKGDWNSRISAYEGIFGQVPPELKTNCSDLNKIRVLRNNIGHSFGRDLEKSRKNGLKELLPTERITSDRTTRYQLSLIHI